MSVQIVVQLNTDDENLATLCSRYWELNDQMVFRYTVAELASGFGVPSNRLPKLVAEYSSALSADDVCSKCQTPYVFSSRSDFQQRSRHRQDWMCERCRREEAEAREAERLRAQERYRAIIQQQYGSGSPGPIDWGTLSLENSVYLLSFFRLLAVEDFKFGQSLSSAKRRLSPTDALDIEILRQLFNQHLISVHPNSPLDAFEGEQAETFYLRKVLWHLPFALAAENPKDFASLLEEVLRGDDWPAEWRSGGLSLWKKIALNECLQYFYVALGEHGFTFNPGEKTILVFNTLLESYSVAQIYNLIWRAVKDAAAFYVRENVTKQHAANTVIGNMQRYGEQARTENWSVKPYNRNFNCPQSLVSEVLFNVVLRIGDDGFKRVPDISRLAALPQFALTMTTQLVQ